MVVDYKLFTSGQPIQPNTLWIVSQTPGMLEFSDVSDVLSSQGYWISYNIAYYPDLWQRLGYQTEVNSTPNGEGSYLYSYSESFRALMFARDAPKVTTMSDMQQIIRQNKYQTDPLSRGSCQLAIASRFDLCNGPISAQQSFGASDAKIVSSSMVMNHPQSVIAISGPTSVNQVPYTWSTSLFANQPHLGMPDTFDFDWQTFTVASLPTETISNDVTVTVATE
jgi:hypothetical protein